MEATITIAKAETKSGQSERGPWTRYEIVSTDRTKYQTFAWSKVAPALAWEQVQVGMQLQIDYTSVQRGEFTNYVIQSAVPVIQVQPEPQATTSVQPPPQVGPKLPPACLLRNPPKINQLDQRWDEAMKQAENLLALRIQGADPERMMRWIIDLAGLIYPTLPSVHPEIQSDEIPIDESAWEAGA